MPVADPEILIDRALVLVCWVELESATCTVKLEVPVAVGVPLIFPELRDRPVGREPDRIDHVYGAVPPVAVSELEYPVPV